MDKLFFIFLLTGILTVPLRTNATSTKNQASLESLLEVYIQMKNSLVIGQNIQTLSGEFLKKATALNNLSTEEQKAWNTSSSAIQKDAEGIASTTDLEKQRKYFSSLSVHLYPVIKVMDLKTDLYYQYCPMYNHGKGAYWISEKSTIQNPYYGKKMLTCGSTKEKLH